jgi:hypothetical protein
MPLIDNGWVCLYELWIRFYELWHVLLNNDHVCMPSSFMGKFFLNYGHMFLYAYLGYFFF